VGPQRRALLNPGFLRDLIFFLCDLCMECSLQFLDQIIGGVRGKKTGHVLDAERVGSHLLDPLGQRNPLGDGVDRAAGVGDGPLGMLPLFDDRLRFSS